MGTTITKGIKLTTTGTSGAATLVGSTLNIPQYSGGASANPSVITASYVDGTIVTGTTSDTISTSLLIPANTFTSNGMLEVLTRATKTGVAGSLSVRIYKNTTNSLTGATLVGPLLSSGTNIWCQGLRTFRVNSNLLTGLTTSTSSTQDYQGNNNTSFSTTFTTSVDNYIIIAIQLGSASDTAKVEMAKAVRYI
jgi:hypothetical protein